MTDLSKVSTSELYRAAGLMQCDRMLWSLDPKIAAEMDAKIAALQQEIERRKSAGVE